jgi:hypothetical protein
MSNWYLQPCEPDEITATDLRQEIAENPEVLFETYRLKSETVAEVGCLIFSPDLYRAGVALGADAEWTDCSSAEDALRRWTENEMVN